MPDFYSTAPIVSVVDEALLTEMLQSIRAMAYSFARSSGIDAEELLQDVAMRMTQKWDMIMGAEQQRAYVRQLARNAMINAYRKIACRRGLALSCSMQALEEVGVQF
jgi:DNA-directed RNA polymerase specialized sigma24 family protein